MAPQSKAVPKPPARRRERLDSLSNPQPRPPPQLRQNKPLKCPDPTCNCSGFTNEDDKVICETCGAVVQEYSMVTDIQYGISGSGRAVVHGHHVGADQAYNRNGMLYDRNRQTTSEEVTNLAGKRYMVQISAALGVQQSLVDSGMQVFRLASANNFIQGRRTKSVAAVALYVACRTQRDNPNQHMLIDFSDILQLNVFHLGQIYKGLIDMLRINPNGHIIQPINPEDLILRFSQRLEFGDDTMRVANDAVRIVQRMNRDWMTPGRRPAGICGAALILAARMNNFRRTVREVVYVVKVQENTIFKRLDEFKVTESSGLTVEEFRTIDLERAMDPPSFTANKNGKKRRRRQARHLEFDDDGDNDLPTDVNIKAASSAQPVDGHASNDTANVADNPLPTPDNTQQPQNDRENMPPPPLPIDPNLVRVSNQHLSELSGTNEGTSSGQETNAGNPSSSNNVDTTNASSSQPSPKKRRGRPPKNPKSDTPLSSQPDTPSAPATESDLTSALLDPLNIDSVSSIASGLPSSSTDPNPEDVSTDPPPQTSRLRSPVPETPEIDPSEFDSDPEVANCLLTPNEVTVKTRIWTHENHDYLRAQFAKELKQQLAEQNGTQRPPKKRKTRRRGRVGDLRTTYGIGEEGGAPEGSPVAGTPEDAVMRMLGVRAYSKKLNYEVLRGAYTPSSASRAGSEAGGSSRRGSVTTTAPPADAASPASGTETPPPTVPGTAAPHGEQANDEDARPEAVEASSGARAQQQREIDNLVGEMEEEGVYDDDDENGDGDDDDGGGGGGDSE